MSLLTLVSNVAVKVGINVPSFVIGNTNTEVIELLAFAQEEGKELLRRFYWQELRKEKTFTTAATEEQEALPSDFDRFVNDTFWNRTRKHPLYGPLNPQQWQYNKSWVSSPITDSFTFRANKILINPVPTAGETIAYEYISKNFCQSSGGTGQSAWAADTDTCILDERLMELGMIVRFKLSKGLDAGADVAKYDTQVMLASGFNSPKATLKMYNGVPSVGPGVIVQEGDWSL